MGRSSQPLGRPNFLSGRLTHAAAVSPRKGRQNLLGRAAEKNPRRIMAGGSGQEERSDACRSIGKVLSVFAGAAPLVQEIHGTSSAVLAFRVGRATSRLRSDNVAD